MMSEQFRHNAPMVSPQADSEVVALIKKMQQQLVFLEKKVDALISQSQERPFRKKPFLKPYRSFGRSPRDRGAEHYSNSGEREFAPGRHFEKHQSDESHGFGRKKKPFFHSRKERR